MIADYHFIRQRKLKIRDLYIGDNSSDYWFIKGLNWRAFLAFIFGVWPMLREYSMRLYYLLQNPPLTPLR